MTLEDRKARALEALDREILNEGRWTGLTVKNVLGLENYNTIRDELLTSKPKEKENDYDAKRHSSYYP
mgnify:CR=1 FL=1